MSGAETLAVKLEREGALSLEEVLRIVPPVCDRLLSLADAGTPSTATLTSIAVSADAPPLVSPVAFEGTPRELVRSLAGLTFELLKGAPPPATPDSSDFIGLRPEIVRPIHAALVGTGASDLLTFARQLRALGSGGTAQVEQLVVPNTKISDRYPAAAGAQRVGQIFGAYQLVRRLGEGGMGEVYVGRHTRLGREVAIKVLRDEFAGMPDVVHRFFQEAKVVNDLKHPNTVEILDFVEEPGRIYLVMELLEGRTLAELDHEQGPLQVARISRLIAQACTALDAAHRQGVVHRDIKPENLFVVTRDGAEIVKVLDFGVARRLTGAPQTQAGLVLGTPFYMAPEQAAGRAVDGRADLYSVGVTLYELLSRDSMSSVTTPQRLIRAASGEPIPDTLTSLVVSLLSLDPSARPASAKAVQDVLVEIAQRPPPPPAPTTGQAMAHAGLTPSTSRSPLWLLLAAAVLVGGVLAVAFTRKDEPGTPPAAKPVEAAPPPPLEPVKPAVVTPPDAPRPATPEYGTAPARPKVKPPRNDVTPPPVEPPADPLASYRPRIADVRRRYDALLRKFGDAQLTTLEKAAIAQAFADVTAGAPSDLDVSLSDAEHALTEAERRLGR